MRTLQVIGLQRSGTSWLRSLLNRNFIGNCRVIDRHRMPNEPDNSWEYGALYFVIYKRLDHWLNSIKRFTGQMEKLRPELFPSGVFDMEAGARCYSKFYQAWREIPPGPIHFISYEKLLSDPQAFLVNIHNLYGLEKRPGDGWVFGKEIFGYMPQSKIDYYLCQGEFAPKRGAGNGRVNDLPGPKETDGDTS